MNSIATTRRDITYTHIYVSDFMRAEPELHTPTLRELRIIKALCHGVGFDPVSSLLYNMNPLSPPSLMVRRKQSIICMLLLLYMPSASFYWQKILCVTLL
jgi:hypothetical protein